MGLTLSTPSLVYSYCHESDIFYSPCSVSYVAEYKEARQTWEEARKRYWFQEAGGTFELGNLEPWTSYNIRSATIDIKYVQLSFFVTCTQLINFNKQYEVYDCDRK